MVRRTIEVAVAAIFMVAGCGDDTGTGTAGGGGEGVSAAGSTGSVGDGGSTGSVGTTTSTGTGDGGAGGGGSCDGEGVGTSRVFVTSTKQDGNLGGLTGGDAACQARADAACLGGTWMAWLGDGVDGPATRFDPSGGPYTRVGGGVIAENWEDLIDGTIAVPINHDETGAQLPADDDMIVFTAVFHTGGNPTPVNCIGWTDASDSLVPTGLASATDTGWTVTAPYFCSEMHHLYCFEQ